MPSLINIKSTIEEPIRFFLQYPRVDRDSLYQKYKKLDEYDGYFDAKKNVAFVYVETRIDEDVVETLVVELPFEDFIRNEFDQKIIVSKALITEFYNNHPSKDENELAYQKLLRAFIENFQKFKNYPLYPEAELLPSALMEIVKHAMHLYRKLFTNIPIEKQAKRIIKNEEKLIGQTGYILKKEYKKRIPEFHSMLISKSLIDPKTKVEQWYKFFNGNFVMPRINWICKDAPNILWYFIRQIEKSEILIEFPNQQWKYLGSIFKFNGEDITSDFYINHNYLNQTDSKKIDAVLNSLKQ